MVLKSMFWLRQNRAQFTRALYMLKYILMSRFTVMTGGNAWLMFNLCCGKRRKKDT